MPCPFKCLLRPTSPLIACQLCVCSLMLNLHVAALANECNKRPGYRDPSWRKLPRGEACIAAWQFGGLIEYGKQRSCGSAAGFEHHFCLPALPLEPLFSCTMSQLSLEAMVTHTCAGQPGGKWKHA